MLNEVLVVNKSSDTDTYVRLVKNLLPACKIGMAKIKDETSRSFMAKGIRMAEQTLDLASQVAKTSNDNQLSYNIATVGHVLACNIEIYQKGSELLKYKSFMAEVPLALTKVQDTLKNIQERVEKLEEQVQCTLGLQGGQDLSNLKSNVRLLMQEINDWEPFATNSKEITKLRRKAEKSMPCNIAVHVCCCILLPILLTVIATFLAVYFEATWTVQYILELICWGLNIFLVCFIIKNAIRRRRHLVQQLEAILGFEQRKEFLKGPFGAIRSTLQASWY